MYLQGIQPLVKFYFCFYKYHGVQNGTTLCEAIPCPPVRACTPDDPIEEITTCCPKCNRSKQQHMSTDVLQSSMLIYIGVNATLNYNGTFPIPTLVEPTRPTESNITCPLVYAYRIYQTINTSIDQIAFERMDFLSVDVYVWSPDFESVQYEPYSSKAFSERHNNTRFKYIGDATAGKQFGAYIKLKYFACRIGAVSK